MQFLFMAYALCSISVFVEAGGQKEGNYREGKGDHGRCERIPCVQVVQGGKPAPAERIRGSVFRQGRIDYPTINLLDAGFQNYLPY